MPQRILLYGLELLRMAEHKMNSKNNDWGYLGRERDLDERMQARNRLSQAFLPKWFHRSSQRYLLVCDPR